MKLKSNSYSSYEKCSEAMGEKYRSITGKFMQQTTKLNEDEGVDICCTWQSVNQLLDGFQYICNNKKKW